MNDHDEEAWLDSLLQHQGLPGLSDGGFQERVLHRLPPPERKGRRALVLGLSLGGAAVGVLLTAMNGGGVMSSPQSGALVVPCSLATALLWYVVDLLME